MESKPITTEDVARRFGTGVNALVVYLHRHPEFKPKGSFGGTYIWTEDEIEALAQHRMRPISRGKKKQS